MIRIKTEDYEDGVTLEISGHAESFEDSARVCAGVSTLAVTLWIDLGLDPKQFEGLLNSGGGYVHMIIPSEKLAELRFTLLGLLLLAKSYTEHFELFLNDTRVSPML